VAVTLKKTRFLNPDLTDVKLSGFAWELGASLAGLVKVTSPDNHQYEFGEYRQEEFSDDSINVHCVLSWRLSASQRLTVNFHNSFRFDSETCPKRQHRLLATAIETLRSIA